MENIRLLLVDDETDFRKTLVRRLSKRNVFPDEAGSGEECLSILKEKPMDVVLLDVKMPGMNGIETLHHIKKEHPATEVILLTGQATTKDGVEGIKSGAFDYLGKPLEFEQLVSKIKQAHEKILRSGEKQREKNFRAKMEQQMIATERLASLGTMATGVAHEINNPLAIIKESAGWMRLLLKRKEISNLPVRQNFELALDKIEIGIDRAKRITHQLLGFVRKDTADLSKFSIKDLINETALLVNKEAKAKNIEIIHEIYESFDVWSDPYRLRQVLINLSNNAIHATGKGGKITIIVKNVDDNGVMVTFSDTGKGIPNENLEKIFEPFFSTKGPNEGTGLGLFVTRSIIDKLGGTIEVKSQLGHGTDFYVKLPKYHKMQDKSNEFSDVLNRITKYASKHF